MFPHRTCNSGLRFPLIIVRAEGWCILISQVLTVGALHQIDSAVLRSSANAWHDEFAPLPKPLLVVNIGGPTSKLHPYDVVLSYILKIQLKLVRYMLNQQKWIYKFFLGL